MSRWPMPIPFFFNIESTIGCLNEESPVSQLLDHDIFFPRDPWELAFKVKSRVGFANVKAWREGIVVTWMGMAVVGVLNCMNEGTQSKAWVRNCDMFRADRRGAK